MNRRTAPRVRRCIVFWENLGCYCYMHGKHSPFFSCGACGCLRVLLRAYSRKMLASLCVCGFFLSFVAHLRCFFMLGCVCFVVCSCQGPRHQPARALQALPRDRRRRVQHEPAEGHQVPARCCRPRPHHPVPRPHRWCRPSRSGALSFLIGRMILSGG